MIRANYTLKDNNPEVSHLIDLIYLKALDITLVTLKVVFYCVVMTPQPHVWRAATRNQTARGREKRLGMKVEVG